MRILNDYNLLQHNTFGINTCCKEFIEYESLDELKHIAATLQAPYLHIGGGSNLLFAHDYDGTILHCAIKGITPLGDNLIEVGGGELWDDVVDYCVGNGYYGAENLSLIPGETGAAAVQNIGAYGAEIKDIIAWVDVFHLPTRTTRRMMVGECQYAYRSSIFKTELKDQCAVYSVTLRLQPAFTPRLDYFKDGVNIASARELREHIINTRNSKLPDPKVTGNAGSFFMNPIVSEEKFLSLLNLYPTIPHYPAPNGVKIPAGWMIEQCGWKGKSKGNAGVYAKQALVLVNNGDADGEEIISLCETIQKDVMEKFGISITPEVKIIR